MSERLHDTQPGDPATSFDAVLHYEKVPAHDLMLHAHPHDRPHVEPHEHPHQHREGWTHSHSHFHAEPDDEFRQQTAEFTARNDELLRRLASSGNGEQG